MLRDCRELQQRGRYYRVLWEGWGSPDWPGESLKGITLSDIFKGILFIYFVQRSNSEESTGHHCGNERPCSGDILTKVLFNESCDIILLVLRPGLVPEHCCHFQCSFQLLLIRSVTFSESWKGFYTWIVLKKTEERIIFLVLGPSGRNL